MNGIKGSITSNADFITAARMGWVSRTHLLSAVEREGKTGSVCPPVCVCVSTTGSVALTCAGSEAAEGRDRARLGNVQKHVTKDREVPENCHI